MHPGQDHLVILTVGNGSEESSHHLAAPLQMLEGMELVNPRNKSQTGLI